MLATLLLLACSGSPSDDTGPAPLDDTATEDAPPSAPGVAAALHLPHGVLDADCLIRLDLAASGDPSTVVATTEIAARGGEWLWLPVDAAGSWLLTGTDAGCIETSDEVPYTSSAFSVGEGQVAIWWWLSTQEGLDLLTEGEDFERGRATVELDEGAAPDPLITFAENIGAVVEPTETADTYLLSFAEDRPVSAMLAEMSRYDRYVDGAPVWIRDAPSWW